MLSLVRQGMDSDHANYQRIQGNNPDGTRNPAYDDLLDVDNYIDYMYSNFWGGTGDWPGHNYYAACRRPPNSTGFKFFNWDAEGAMVIWSSLNANVTNVSDGAAIPYAALRQNPEFCLLFADHVQKHLFNNGPTTLRALLRPLQEAGRPGGTGDHCRVGPLGRSVQCDAVHAGRLAQERDYILNTYMPQRPALVLNQLKNAGLYPTARCAGLPGQRPGAAGRRRPVERPADAWRRRRGRPSTTRPTAATRDCPRSQSADNKIVTLVPENAPKRVLVPSVANGGDQLANISPGFAVTFYKAKGTVDSLTTAEAVIANAALRTSTAKEQARVINYFNTGTPGNFDSDRPFPGTTINVDVENFVVLVTGKVMIPASGQLDVRRQQRRWIRDDACRRGPRPTRCRIPTRGRRATR